MVTCHRDPADLRESLRTVGMLALPLVRAGAAGCFQVVCGWRRLMAVRRLGWERVRVQVLPGDAPEAAGLLMSLHDNACGRGFNPAERAGLIVRLGRHWDRETVIREFLPRLGLPPAVKQWELHRRLSELEPEFQELAARGLLSLEAAGELAAWEAADRAAVAPVWHELTLSHSKQRELLDYLGTLARREDCRPRDLMARQEVRDIVAHPTATPGEKTARLWDLLRRWCFPRLSAAREEFEAHLKRLGLHGQRQVRLTPSPHFEGTTCQLTVEFESAAGLAQTLTRLLDLTAREEFEALTRI